MAVLLISDSWIKAAFKNSSNHRKVRAGSSKSLEDKRTEECHLILIGLSEIVRSLFKMLQ